MFLLESSEGAPTQYTVSMFEIGTLRGKEVTEEVCFLWLGRDKFVAWDIFQVKNAARGDMSGDLAFMELDWKEYWPKVRALSYTSSEIREGIQPGMAYWPSP